MIRHRKRKWEDRVSTKLERMGYQLHWYVPSQGQTLPRDTSRFAAAVVYGAPVSANDKVDWLNAERDWIADWTADDRPFLGICLGAQLLAQTLGAAVGPHPQGLHEIGFARIDAEQDDLFPEGSLHLYQWHNEGFTLPRDSTRLARGEVFSNQAFRYRHACGVQFHPEVTITMMRAWIREAGHLLKQPNAHDEQRQLHDARLYDTKIDDWVTDLLKQWAP